MTWFPEIGHLSEHVHVSCARGTPDSRHGHFVPLYRNEDTNIVRLKAALIELNVVARNNPRNLPFGEIHLRTKGHKLAIFNAGALGVLGSINNAPVYGQYM